MAVGDRNRGERRLFTIGVAAELVNVHQQTLRHYERLGLIEPARGKGEIRYFSPGDIERILQIRRLIEELGVNLAGVEVILHMREQMESLQREMEATVAQLQAEHEAEVRRLKEAILRVQGAGAEIGDAG
jgi:MerR family transcriptional regulator, heat shock protein HspR